MRISRVAATAFILFIGANATQAGEWTVKLGAHNVDPKSDNGTLAGALDVDVSSNLQPSIILEYLLTRNWGLELLAAVPFEHDVKVDGTRIASLTHLPPTFSLQYHFNAEGAVSPYLGIGFNYTFIYNEDTHGPIAGSNISLDNSFGLAGHAGIDFRVNDRWSLGFDLRWIDIDTGVRLDGANIGDVNVDPLVYGAYAMYRF